MKNLNILKIKSFNYIIQRKIGLTKPSLRSYSTEHNDITKNLIEKLKKHKADFRKNNFLKQYDYSKHYSIKTETILDAAARILSFQDPCTAVIKEGATLKVSYNNQKGHRLGLNDYKTNAELLGNRINILTKAVTQYLNDSTNGKKALLSIALKHSTAFHDHLKILRGLTQEQLGVKEENAKQLIKYLIDFTKSLKQYKWSYSNLEGKQAAKSILVASMEEHLLTKKSNFSFLIEVGNAQDDVLKKYYTLLDYLTDNLLNIKNKSLKDDILKNLLPMLYDTAKMHHFLNEINEILVLDNEHELHCEVNIIEKSNLTSNNQYISNENFYVGISQLCCFFCEVILSHKNICHAGSHGLFFFYDTKHLFIDKNLALTLITNIQKMIQHDKREIFEKIIDSDNADIIENFITLNDESVKIISNNLNKLSRNITKTSDYCFGKNDHNEHEIKNFHLDDPNKSLAEYTIYLIGENS